MITFNDMDINKQEEIVYSDKDEEINNLGEALGKFKIEEEEDVSSDETERIFNNIKDEIDKIASKYTEAEEEPSIPEDMMVLNLVKDEDEITHDEVEERHISIYDMCKTVDETILNEFMVEEDEEILNEFMDVDDDDDEDDLKSEEEVMRERYKHLDGIKFINKNKWELTSIERWWIKNMPDKYKLGMDPREEYAKRKKKRDKKEKKARDKFSDMSDVEIAQYKEELRIKKELKKYNRDLKQFLDMTDKKKIKKHQKLQDKINAAYRKQRMDENAKSYKNIVDMTYKRDFKKYKREVMGNKKYKHDPYARYRKNSNIITVAEAEAYESDFKSSFLKNLEEELMQRLNEPIDIGGKTVVEYYDKKGRLKSKEYIQDTHKKQKKTNKKKDKKKDKKYKNKVLSPDYKDF